MHFFISQRDRDERRDQAEVASGELLPERRRIGRHESPVAELAAGIAGSSDLVEDLVVRSGDGITIELEDAPRTGRIGNTQHGSEALKKEATPLDDARGALSEVEGRKHRSTEP